MKSFSFTSRIYYQYKPERLPCCGVTTHALLHIADSIKVTGPVWCYWAFPMERYCGVLRRAIRSHRFPYASMARFVCETAQLTQIANVYNMASTLALRAAPSLPGNFTHPQCTCVNFRYICIIPSSPVIDPSCVLMFPRSQTRPADYLIAGIAAALATRLDVDIHLVKGHLKNADIEEWGRVRRIDSDAGDTMRASSMIVAQDDSRDATYVRVNPHVDANRFIHADVNHSSMRCWSTSMHANLGADLNTNSRRSTVNFNIFT
jgi:hypothetical protein